jgi:hypothetical protein
VQHRSPLTEPPLACCIAQIGAGKLEYQKARRLLERWRQMQLGWVVTSQPPITVGQPLCISAQSLWVWNRLPLRIVYRKEGKAKVPASSALTLGEDGSASPRRHTLTCAHVQLRVACRRAALCVVRNA